MAEEAEAGDTNAKQGEGGGLGDRCRGSRGSDNLVPGEKDTLCRRIVGVLRDDACARTAIKTLRCHSIAIVVGARKQVDLEYQETVVGSVEVEKEVCRRGGDVGAVHEYDAI